MSIKTRQILTGQWSKIESSLAFHVTSIIARSQDLNRVFDHTEYIRINQLLVHPAAVNLDGNRRRLRTPQRHLSVHAVYARSQSD